MTVKSFEVAKEHCYLLFYKCFWSNLLFLSKALGVTDFGIDFVTDFGIDFVTDFGMHFFMSCIWGLMP